MLPPMLIPEDALTSKRATGVVPPIAPANDAVLLPAFIINSYSPLMVDPNETVLLELVIVVSRTRVVAPLKLTKPVVEIVPPILLVPLIVIEVALKVPSLILALAKLSAPTVHVPDPDFVIELDALVRSLAQVTVRPLVLTLNA